MKISNSNNQSSTMIHALKKDVFECVRSAVSDGIVKVTATATDGTGITGSRDITISG